MRSNLTSIKTSPVYLTYPWPLSVECQLAPIEYDSPSQAAQTDDRWDFFQIGQPLPEEDTQLYTARRKRDRLNEEYLLQLLTRLGASPWSESFYALPGRCFVMRRSAAPAKIIKRRREDVLTKA